MKTTWDELMRYAPEQEYSLTPLEDSETERLLKRTMAKLNTTGKARKPQKFVRKFLLAAALAALLCVSVFAAYSLGWFDQLFGSSAALVKESVASYDAATEVDITYPTYTEAEQAMLAEGTMQVPDQAQIAETGVSAQTDDFVFTLESMLVSKDTLYAIMRIEAKTDDAAAELAALPDASLEEKEGGGMLLVLASNNSGEGREREWKNGGMGMDIIEVDGNTAYALLCNLGGEFEPGDLILFDMSFHGENAYLFEVPAPEQLQTELVVPLNESAYDGKTYRWDTATITPISFRLDGSGYGRNETTISLTLNDGTNFSLTNPGNESTPYGTYGSLGHSGTGGGDEESEIKSSWLFSRLVDLNELSSITVDGVTYSLQ